jgi:glycosyltransferase involved in cell wall biosynthesis
MFPPHHQGGYEQDWAAGVAALRAAGHEVEVLVSGHREPGVHDVEEPGVFRDLRWYWHEHDFPARTLRECLAIERHNADVFARRVAQFQPDLVSWWPMGGLSIGLIEQARRRSLRAIGVVYDDWMVYGPNVDGWQRRRIHVGGVTERLTGVPTRIEIGAAARWLFASESVRSAARGAIGDLRDTELLAPGLDEVFLSAAPPRPEWRWHLLAPGRLDPRKGLRTAVEALALLPAAHLTIVGGGDDRHAAELRELAQRSGVAERFAIEPPRPRPELASAYADCDAIVVPVEWAEPFGLVPLEAMGVGRPVVATGRGGSGGFLRDGENCLLFEPGNAEALASAVTRLANDAALREQIRAGGFATAPTFARSRWDERVVAEHEARVG